MEADLAMMLGIPNSAYGKPILLGERGGEERKESSPVSISGFYPRTARPLEPSLLSTIFPLPLSNLVSITPRLGSVFVVLRSSSRPSSLPFTRSLRVPGLRPPQSDPWSVWLRPQPVVVRSLIYLVGRGKKEQRERVFLWPAPWHQGAKFIVQWTLKAALCGTSVG